MYKKRTVPGSEGYLVACSCVTMLTRIIVQERLDLATIKV